MPYASDKQRRWAHTAAGKRALGGSARVHEWDAASRGMKLPERARRHDRTKKDRDKDECRRPFGPGLRKGKR